MRVFQVLAGLVLLIAVSACGRAGAPELPPAAAARAKAAEEAGQPAVADRPFILDRLIE